MEGPQGGALERPRGGPQGKAPGRGPWSGPKEDPRERPQGGAHGGGLKEGPWRSPEGPMDRPQRGPHGGAQGGPMEGSMQGPHGGPQGEAPGRGPSAPQCEALAGQCSILCSICMSEVTNCNGWGPREGQRESKAGFLFVAAILLKSKKYPMSGTFKITSKTILGLCKNSLDDICT